MMLKKDRETTPELSSCTPPKKQSRNRDGVVVAENKDDDILDVKMELHRR